jgi:hypothetical protein
MTFKPETEDYLPLATENRELAFRLSRSTDAPHRWIAIIAFESACQFIQAILWERYSVRVSSHPQRLREIESSADLSPIAARYRHLYDIAERARQAPRYQFDDVLSRYLLDDDLAVIESHISTLLDHR